MGLSETHDDPKLRAFFFKGFADKPGQFGSLWGINPPTAGQKLGLVHIPNKRKNNEQPSIESQIQPITQLVI